MKARIEAIARFKRFPQGMGLVSGCIVFALSLSLVAGVPVSAAGEETTVRASQEIEIAPELVAETLALASQNRATTVAGALDAYGKGSTTGFTTGSTTSCCVGPSVPPRRTCPPFWNAGSRIVGGRHTAGAPARCSGG